jgi:RND family efflux transporter MFP subunit
MKKKLKRIIAIFIAIPVLIISFQVVRRVLRNREVEVEQAAVPVITDTPEIGTLEYSVLYSGTLKPEKMVTVLPKGSGKLEAIVVEEGQVLDQGDLIALVDKDIAKLQMDQVYAGYQAALAQSRKAEAGVRPKELENAKALLAQAEKDIEVAKTNLERSKRLVEAGTIPQSKYEETERIYLNAETEVENARRRVELMEEGASKEELEMAQANAEAAEARYELAKLQYENTFITAPVSGLVARILAEEGSMVGPESPILLLVQDDPMYAEIPIPEKYYGRINEKTETIEARIYPTAYPDSMPYSGRVTNIARILDPASRTFNLEVAVENPENKLRPGMYVNVEIVLDIAENAVMVPESSLVYRNDKQVVFVVDGESVNTAKMQAVMVGLRKNGIAEISEGVKAEDEVIIKGNVFLEEGQIIEIVDG